MDWDKYVLLKSNSIDFHEITHDYNETKKSFLSFQIFTVDIKNAFNVRLSRYHDCLLFIYMNCVIQ